ncbi:hypothetical protein RintRC_2332 [Richelia intracellularis]|nr:hypothetical protein RintRC_2332 [Richelia intracellularis]
MDAIVKKLGNMIKKSGIAEFGDDFTKFSTIYQWFQTLIHAALMQRQKSFSSFFSLV